MSAELPTVRPAHCTTTPSPSCCGVLCAVPQRGASKLLVFSEHPHILKVIHKHLTHKPPLPIQGLMANQELSLWQPLSKSPFLRSSRSFTTWPRYKEGKDRLKKGANHSRFVGDSFNKRGNLGSISRVTTR